MPVLIGVGDMVLILARSPNIALGFLIVKIITQQYKFQAEKEV